MDARLRVRLVSKELDALFAGLPATLSAPDVAALLGISKQGIYRWINDGVIPAYRVGAVWIIVRDELKATLEAGSNLRPGFDTARAARQTKNRKTQDKSTTQDKTTQDK